MEAEDIRPDFWGVERISPVTGEKELYYPKWKTDVRRFLVSLPIVMLFILFGAYISHIVTEYQAAIEKKEETELEDDTMYILSNVAYTTFLFIYGLSFDNITDRLTNAENHKFKSKYMHSKIFKTILLAFTVNFYSLFYYAFVLKDFPGVKSQLVTFIIVLQLLEQIMEAGIPYFKHVYSRKKTCSLDIKNEQKQQVLKVPRLQVTNPYAKAANFQINGGDYPEGKLNTYTDYMAVFTQFGLVFLFSPVFPLAALICIFINIFQIHSDAFKMCHAMKRPRARQAKDIGIWQRAFEVVGLLCVLTNCALLALSQAIRNSYGRNYSDLDWFCLFVVSEHLIIVAKFIIRFLIPDMTAPVREGLEKQKHAAELELKKKMQEQQKAMKKQIKSLPFRDDYVSSLCDFDPFTDKLDGREDRHLLEAAEDGSYQFDEQFDEKDPDGSLRRRKIN